MNDSVISEGATILRINKEGFNRLEDSQGTYSRAGEIKNLTIEVDSVSKILQVEYDLINAKEDSLKVILQMSRDKGLSYSTVSMANASGDIGFPVLPGTHKRIKVSYDSVVIRGHLSVRLICEGHFLGLTRDVLARVDTVRIKRNLAALSGSRQRAAHPEHTRQCVDLIINEFMTNKLNVFSMDFPNGNKKRGVNIIGELCGLEQERDQIILSAHYDTVHDTPGADDNASGVAGMLEAMRILSSCALSKSVSFVAFDYEELDLKGSKEFIQSGFTNGKHLLGAVNFDMIGYRSFQSNSQKFPEALEDDFAETKRKIEQSNFKADFILTIANQDSRDLSRRFSNNTQKYVPQLKVIALELDGQEKKMPHVFKASDHASFWDAGFSALSIGDSGPLRNANYHKPNDNLETIDLEFVSQIVKSTLAMIIEMADLKNCTVAYANW